MQSLGRFDGASRIVGEQRRYLQGNPAVDAAAGFKRREKQGRGALQVFYGQFKKQRLAGFPFFGFCVDGLVIGGGIANRLFKDGGIGGQSGHGKIRTIALQRAAVQ